MCLDDLLAAGVTRCARTVILNATGSTHDTETFLTCYTLNSLQTEALRPQTEALNPQTEALRPQTEALNPQTEPHSPRLKPTTESIPLLLEIGTAPLTPPSGNDAVLALPKLLPDTSLPPLALPLSPLPLSPSPFLTSLFSRLPHLTP